MSDKRFEGKQVVVTGGGAGIGRAISKRLAAEGASVTIFERNIDAAKANDILKDKRLFGLGNIEHHLSVVRRLSILWLPLKLQRKLPRFAE